jgi:hypothetical protein
MNGLQGSRLKPEPLGNATPLLKPDGLISLSINPGQPQDKIVLGKSLPPELATAFKKNLLDSAIRFSAQFTDPKVQSAVEVLQQRNEDSLRFIGTIHFEMAAKDNPVADELIKNFLKQTQNSCKTAQEQYTLFGTILAETHAQTVLNNSGNHNYSLDTADQKQECLSLVSSTIDKKLASLKPVALWKKPFLFVAGLFKKQPA